MPTRACFSVVPTTTVRLDLLTKSVRTCLSIKVWPVQQILALKPLIVVVALPFGQGMSLAQALQDRKRSAAPKLSNQVVSHLVNLQLGKKSV